MANRVRLTVLAALAMLSVFTLGAGVAVAALLPARLALWQIPRVAAVRVAVVASGTQPAPQCDRGTGGDAKPRPRLDGPARF